MSGIAEVMHNLGYRVQGSDVAEGYVVQDLRKRGIPIEIGHKPENVDGAAVVVVSTAVKRGNPEARAALERRIPVVRRAEILAELLRPNTPAARAGTHGTTATHTLLATPLDAGGAETTVTTGGGHTLSGSATPGPPRSKPVSSAASPWAGAPRGWRS